MEKVELPIRKKKSGNNQKRRKLSKSKKRDKKKRQRMHPGEETAPGIKQKINQQIRDKEQQYLNQIKKRHMSQETNRILVI